MIWWNAFVIWTLVIAATAGMLIWLKVKERRIRIVAASMLGTFLLVFTSIQLGNVCMKHMKAEELKKQGVYEIENSFEYMEWNNSCEAYFVVCEPSENKEEVLRFVEWYCIVNDLASLMWSRIDSLDEIDYIRIYFFKPSRKFPIGWSPSNEEGMYPYFNMDGGIDRNILVEVKVSKDGDYKYYGHAHD